MVKRRRLSTIDRAPPEIRDLINSLRRDHGFTIDEIMAKLGELDSELKRSAVGLHVKKLGDIGERLRQSRAIAEGLVDKFGDQPDNRLARVNLELMHDMVMRVVTAEAIDEETGEATPVTFGPEDVMFLSRSLQSLASAQKTDADRMDKAIKAAAERATKEAVEKAVGAARANGLSAKGVADIRLAVLGSEG